MYNGKKQRQGKSEREKVRERGIQIENEKREEGDRKLRDIERVCVSRAREK